MKVRIAGPAPIGRAQRRLLQMGIRDGKYRGDVPAARIADDGLAYQKRRLLCGLARLAPCERNRDEDLYGAIWERRRPQLVRIRIKFIKPTFARTPDHDADAPILDPLMTEPTGG
jgi:hypothetical protein